MTTHLHTDTAKQGARDWASPLLWVFAAASVISNVATVA